jgi:hypothetical protein
MDLQFSDDGTRMIRGRSIHQTGNISLIELWEYCGQMLFVVNAAVKWVQD